MWMVEVGEFFHRHAPNLVFFLVGSKQMQPQLNLYVHDIIKNFGWQVFSATMDHFILLIQK